MKKYILISGIGVIVIIAAIVSTIIIHGAIVAFTTPKQSVTHSTNSDASSSSCTSQKTNKVVSQTCQGQSQMQIQSHAPHAPGTPIPTPTPVPTTPPTATTVAIPPTPTPAPQSTPPTPTPAPNSSGSGGGSTSTENQLAQQLFNQINSDRAAQGLPAYAWNATLARGAYQHNITMTTTGCGLAHQCPNEPAPCQRITNEGITWMACGENIGYTSPYPDAWTAIKQNIEGGMLAEKPPDDGHRKNLLSTSFHQIGVAVLIDSKGTAWVSEDFTN